MPSRVRRIRSRLQLLKDELLYSLRNEGRTTTPATTHPPKLSQLEERILMSVSPGAMVAEVVAIASEGTGGSGADSAQPVETSEIGTLTPPATDNGENPSQAADASTPTTSDRSLPDFELIVIDSRVQDADSVLSDLLNTDRRFRLLRLDLELDGLSQVTEALERIRHVSAIHLISHGRSGELLLGATTLNSASLPQHAAELLAWQQTLTDRADLLIYGCDVASDPAGKALIESISRLTGADVAASEDRTGHSQFQGDWELEFATGVIETEVAVSQRQQAAWDNLLGVITVTTTDDVLDGDTSSVAALLSNVGSDGFISLREALIATNNSSGADTIYLTAGTWNLSIDGHSEDAALSGDLDVTDSLTLIGAGSGQTIIDANGLDRVFDLHSGSTSIISDVTIQGGLRPANSWGGGILVQSGASLDLIRSVVRNNATGSGAAIYSSGLLNVTDTWIDGNAASDWGGGLYNDGGQVTFQRVTVSGNTAGRDGAGIYHSGTTASLDLTNTTLSGNTAGRYGGALYTSRTVTATSVTIAFNQATDGAGVFTAGGLAQVTFGNSLLFNPAGNNAGSSMDSVGNNIDSDGSAGFTHPTDLNNVQPLLDPTLTNNGGFVPTHRLLPGSPAIDGGTATGAPDLDARRVDRDSVPDIGAMEVQGQLSSTTEFRVNTTVSQSQQTTSATRGSTQAIACLLYTSPSPRD